MTFRQNEFFLKETIFIALLMTALSIFFVVFVDSRLWPMLFASAACDLCAFHMWRTEPTITMDDQGVRCTQRDKLLWDLSWSQIAEVRKSTHLHTRAIELIPTVEPKRDLHTPQDQLFLGFQLCKTAKIALKTYCPGLKAI